MRLKDIPILFFTAVFVSLFIFPGTRNLYLRVYAAVPLLVSFLKFSLLAPFGEMISLRLKTGVYYRKGFGLIPKMLIWGLLGCSIYAAFSIYAAGIPKLIPVLLLNNTPFITVLRAFIISVFMNISFAPLMMLVHHITDNYLTGNNGVFRIRGFRMLPLLKSIDWDKMWGFVFKKTIPFFWIPAHTITFLLPSQFRTIFAALLSIMLGIFLGALGGSKKKNFRSLMAKTN